jgi:xylulokinase
MTDTEAARVRSLYAAVLTNTRPLLSTPYNR